MLWWRQTLAAVAGSLPFRIVLAVAILYAHVALMKRLAHDRFGYAFNHSAELGPIFFHPERDAAPDKWDRLIVARWDAEHYEEIGLRGYEYCKDAKDLRPGEFPDQGPACQLAFYPTYGWMGRVVMKLAHVPIDIALWWISLAASFALILMWTSQEMVRSLGLANTYLSLLLLNVFTTGYTLVTVQTEPTVMALTLGAFLCARRRWLVTGALLAGAATAVRITGVATGFAYAALLFALTWRESPRPTVLWAWRASLMALSGWGIALLMAYYWHRFGDPLIYAHAHERAFHHEASLATALWPDGRLWIQSIWAEPNEGLFLAAALLWFALGHRDGIARFPAEARAFWYVLYFGIVGVCIYGSAGQAFGGNSRYMLTVLPLFFAMAAVMRRKPIVLVLWLMMSATHYYHGSMCFYVGQNHPQRLQRCSFARYFRSEEIAAEQK